MANGSILTNKIKNIVGDRDYSIHNHLINNFFKNESKYIVNGKINYLKVFKVLKQNGLMDLKLKKPQMIEICFITKQNSFKAYKILRHTMQVLGYRYVITKSITTDKKNNLEWVVSIKTEYMLDSYMLILELLKNSCTVIDVTKVKDLNWTYTLDFKRAKLEEARVIPLFERVIINKPLKPIMIKSSDADKLEVISRVLNRWYPHIIFYDVNLNVLDTIKNNKITKKLKIKIPKKTVYIVIKDIYNLVNIKRGLTIIIR